MLIIFDLDDTLIDTSGTITPFKFKECLKRLPIQNLSAAYAELLSIYKNIPRSKEALLSFLSRHSLDSKQALEELSAPLPKKFFIPTLPYAKETLAELYPFHTLALVTVGSANFQFEKLEKAGIDRSIFSKIVVLKDADKKPIYEALQREFFYSPKEVWVCGDRIEVDLIPARELGFRTVHVQRKKGQTELWIDHSISSFEELRGCLK